MGVLIVLIFLVLYLVIFKEVKMGLVRLFLDIFGNLWNEICIFFIGAWEGVIEFFESIGKFFG